MRRLFKITGLLLMAMLLFGCEMLNSLLNNETPDNSVSEYEMISTILGRGYDVFDTYADTQCVKSTILDFGAMDEAGIIEQTAIDTTDYYEITGMDKASYQEKLGGSAGLTGEYKYFSGSFDNSFSSTVSSSNSYSYGSILINVKRNLYAVKNRTDTANLKDFLDDTFESRLNDSGFPIDELFNIYGTHVLVGVITGARFDYNFAEKSSDISSTSSLSSDLKSSFSSTFASVSASLSISSDNSTSSNASSATTSVNIVGGNSSQSISNDEGLSNWLNNINNENVVFANFASSTALVPIWKLCDDSSRASNISAAFIAYKSNVDNQDDGDGTVSVSIDLTSIQGRGLKDGDSYDGGNVELTWLVYVKDSNGVIKNISDNYSSGAYKSYQEGSALQTLMSDNSVAPVSLTLTSGDSFTLYVTHVAELDRTVGESGDDDIGYCDSGSDTSYSRIYSVDNHGTWNGTTDSTVFDDKSGSSVGYGIMTFYYKLNYEG